MATRKITITLHDDQVRAIREFVDAGKASSVSAFVQHAVGIALFDAAGWQTMLHDALRQTGGPLTKEECAWADGLLHPPGSNRPESHPPGKRKNKAA
jgi:Arc/MetJ-type ribon-helix-helix transcriptional regulator